MLFYIIEVLVGINLVADGLDKFFWLPLNQNKKVHLLPCEVINWHRLFSFSTKFICNYSYDQ